MLWPGNVQILPEPDYVKIVNMIEKNCSLNNLQPTEIFVKKTLELYEMIIVRHGLMLVGYSFGAKTCAYKILAASLTNLKEAGLNDENISKYVHIDSLALVVDGCLLFERKVASLVLCSP